MQARLQSEFYKFLSDTKERNIQNFSQNLQFVNKTVPDIWDTKTEISENPWQVDSIQAFYYLKCPECEFSSKEENLFQNHALQKHPKSSVLFGKEKLENDKLFKCSYCDANLSCNSKLKRHINDVHGKNVMPIVDGELTIYQCPLCEFKSEDKLEEVVCYV